MSPERVSNSEEDEDEDVNDSPLPIWMEGDSLAPPCQADMEVVRAIIDFAEVTEDDVLYDLGCGDGRICIEAAEKRGARACGVEIEEYLAEKFRRRVAAKKLEDKVSVIQGDLREVDLSQATVVVTYLLPQAMRDIAESHLLPLLRRGKYVARGRAPGVRATQASAVDDGQPRPQHDSTRAQLGPKEELGTESCQGDPGQTISAMEAPSKSWSGPSNPARSEEDVWEGVCRVGSSDAKPCRIVCNTWGIPGAVAVREAAVGQYSGVNLRLFNMDSIA